MTDAINADKVMDLKGLPCPMPIVKVSKGIKEVAVGQVIEASAQTPAPLLISRRGQRPAGTNSWKPFRMTVCSNSTSRGQYRPFIYPALLEMKGPDPVRVSAFIRWRLPCKPSIILYWSPWSMRPLPCFSSARP